MSFRVIIIQSTQIKVKRQQLFFQVKFKIGRYVELIVC